jgi:hypothetical protein
MQSEVKLTPRERRDIFIADRRLAVESTRDLLKWTIAALLTLNSGAALVTFSNLKIRPGLEVYLAEIFIAGAVVAVLGGVFASLVAANAISVAQDKLGMNGPRSKFRERSNSIFHYFILTATIICIGGSFVILLKGGEMYGKVAAYEMREALRNGNAQATKTPAPMTGESQGQCH